jgi:hypothetical protein
MTNKITLSAFDRREQVHIPKWAKAIRLVRNGIDGYPPPLPEQLTIDEFLKHARTYQLLCGGGEWDVLVYAVGNPDRSCRVIYPYGLDNPYNKLRSDKGQRVKLLARFDYMRWVFFTFVAQA